VAVDVLTLSTSQAQGYAPAERQHLWIALGLPVLAAVALMVPRILNADFGLFDDSTSISIAEQTWAGQWNWREDPGGYGRFRPMYWAAFSLIYRLADYQASWYFVGNLLLLAGTTLLLGWMMLALTRSPATAGVAAAAFVLGGPVVEATYTLSKPELLQCFLIVAAGAILYAARRSLAGRLRVRRTLLIAIFVLLAALTKETAGVLLGIALAWLAIGWTARRLCGSLGTARSVALVREFLAACVLGMGAFAVGAVVSSPDLLAAAGPRANFTLDWATVLTNAKAWLHLIGRDWLYLLPLSVGAGCLIAAERGFGQVPLMLAPLVWMGAWIALYLPYRFTPVYYLLPFSLGAAALTGLLVGYLLRTWLGAGGARSRIAIASLVLAVILFLLTIPNIISNAKIQLSVDSANSEMLEYVAETASAGGLTLVNMPDDLEYSWHVGPMLGMVHDRPDLTVEAYPGPGSTLEIGTLVVSPFIENVPQPTVRLGVPELLSRQWEAELLEDLAGRFVLAGEMRHEARLFMIDAPRLMCHFVPDLDLCSGQGAALDTRRFAAGWRVYAISSGADG
jgi:hypothetical protein